MSSDILPVTRLGLRQKWRSLRDLISHLRDIRRREGVPWSSQVREYRRIRRAIGATPREFYRYRMWDTRVPLADRLSFLVWVSRRPLEALLNPKESSRIVGSKISGDDFYRTNGFPTPRRFGVWCPPGFASDATDTIRTRSELVAALGHAPTGVVFKIDLGSGGDFVLVFSAVESDGLRHATGELWSIDRLVNVTAAQGPWLVQERILPHPELVALSGSEDVATLRMVTCRWESGRIFLLPVTLKLPATASGLDNFGAGNVGVAVSENGVLGAAAFGLDGPQIDRHPITNALLPGTRVPHWDAAVALVCRAHAKIPSLRSLGWDVAIAPDGPVILEANTWWGVDVIQQPGLRGLLKGEFLAFVEEIGAGPTLRLSERGG